MATKQWVSGFSVLVLASLFVATPAFAKRGAKKAAPEPEPVEAPAEEAVPEEPPPSDEAEGWGTSPEDETPAQDETLRDVEQMPAEEPAAAAKAPEWFFGADLSVVWVPSFLLKIGLQEAPTVNNASFGVQATHRNPDSGFSFILGLGYTGYGFEGPFRSMGDKGPQDTEVVTSDLGLLRVSGAMVWAAQFSDVVSLEYGFGADLGVILGEMRRSEAYKDSMTGEWVACNGPGDPITSGIEPTSGLPYCYGPRVAYDQDGEHYDVVEERIPPVMVFPMLPLLSLRIAPRPDLVFKANFAYGVAQFTLGLSASYGPDL